MRLKATVILLFSFLSLSAQSDKLVGEYFHRMGDKEEHLIEYILSIREDRTFYFHSYVNHKKGIPWEENKYGKGKWSMEGKVVTFFTEQSDLDEKYTLNFSNSKARFITKPPRDQSDRVINTALQFFASDIFWIERLKILKLQKQLP